MVEQGHWASHYGMALADALLYEPGSPVKHRDEGPFFKIYGVFPQTVIEHKGCSRVIDILDWRGTVKDIMGYRYTGATFEESTFGVQSQPFLVRLMKESPLEIQAFMEEKEGSMKRNSSSISRQVRVSIARMTSRRNPVLPIKEARERNFMCINSMDLPELRTL
jgi:hypothetical protein